MPALEPDEIPTVPRFEGEGAKGVAMRALNLRAWVTARLASSVPLIPRASRPTPRV
jgi:hypothetical protein